jgi:zinc protease
MWRWIVVCAALAASAGLVRPARAQVAPAPAVPEARAPEVRQGRLPNGLRYAVVSTPSARGAMSVRLGIAAGSYEEAEDERGLAHFVEHMAFNGTKNFAEDALSGVFARMGVGFGRDHNAYTSQGATTFHLDLPSAEPAKADAAFLWLADVAEGMLFQPAAVDRERGVVLSEREARSDAGDAWREAMEAFTSAGLRSAARDPAGSVEVVQRATPAQLKAFYDRWYRPENAVVVVVADAPVEALETRVRAVFGAWSGRGAAGVRAPRIGPKPGRADDLFLRADPQAPLAASICRLHERQPDEPSEPAARRAALALLWQNVLEQRLKTLAARPAPAVLETEAYDDDALDAGQVCIGVVPAKGRMEEALSLVGAEVARFEREAPAETEMEAAMEETRAGLRGGIADDATQAAPERADGLMYDLLAHRSLARGREAMRDFNRIVASLTPQDLQSAFRADWTGWGPLVRVTSPEPLEAAPLRTAWTRAPAPVAQAAAAALEWPYASFGRKGRVVKREMVVAPGFVRLTFSNGVVLNFKQTAFESGHVEVKVRFGAGRSELAAVDYQLALLGSAYFKEGGLGRLSLAELEGLTRGAAWDVDLEIADHAFELKGEAYASGLEAQLGILAAYLSDPGFRPSVDALIPGNVEATFQRLRSDPTEVMGQALTGAIAPGAPILHPSLAAASAARSADFARVLKPPITQAPLTVTLVGDVSEAAVVEAMATTLGALPARRATPRERPDTWFMRFPVDAGRTVRVTHEGASDKAVAGLFWPLFTPTAGQRREEYALLMLGAVFEERLVAQVRERLGKSYAPEAGADLRDATDQGYLWAQVESAPADLAAVEAETRAVAQRLRAGDISEADLETARRPILAHMDQRRTANAWWLEALNVADHPAELEEYVQSREWVASVTLEEVRRAAARWLAPEPVAVVVTPSRGPT